MGKDQYRSISEETSGEYKEKGSKFLAIAVPAVSETAVKAQLEQIKKRYFDARHHCYAYRIGPDGEKYRANDDGEPSHSAGTPILNQIKSHEISDVLVVVVRWFGGTKLGVSGLIHAYKTATEEALKNATISEKTVRKKLYVSFPYDLTNDAMRLINEFDIELIEQEYTAQCCMHIAIRKGQYDAFLIRAATIYGLLVEAE
jgi:uncharacterized YigZ family protein